LPGRFIAKKLFGWSDKRYDEEYWERSEWNWKQWKDGRRRRILETIKEKEEIKQKKPKIRKSKKMRGKWATWLTLIMSCKNPRDKKT